MKLYNSGYKLTISLQISDVTEFYIAEHIGRLQIINWDGRKYIHWECSYNYETPFHQAFSEAKDVLKHMKIAIREGKIASLKAEIDCIKYAE
jgi:hypothetical protein